MRIDFYYTQKRVNSMVRPDIDENQIVVTTFTDFNLKDDCSLNAPTFIIVASNMPETNYCIMSNTGASSERPDKYYYFIDEIIHHRKTVWHIRCTIDALATWHSRIREQSAYIERSTNLYNPYVVDSMLPTKNELMQRRIFSYLDGNTATNGESGTFLLRVCASGTTPNTDTYNMGGVDTFFCTQAGLKNFAENFFQVGVAQQVAQTFGNVGAAIVGAFWLPIKIDAINGKTAVSQIFCGGTVNVGSGVYAAGQYTYQNTQTQSVQLTHYGDYRDNPPFRSYFAKLPWLGYVELDSDYIAIRNRAGGGSVTFAVTRMIDFLAGAMKYIVYCDNFVVGHFDVSCRVDVPLSSYNGNGITGVAGGVINKYGETINKWLDSFIGGGDGWGGSTPDKIADTALHSGTYTVVGGAAGNLLGAYDAEIVIFEKAQNTSAEPSSIAATSGRPYNAVATIGSINGFCKTYGFSVQGRMSKEEKTHINALFNNTGVYV